MRHGVGVRADGGHRWAQAAAQVQAALPAALGRPSRKETTKNKKELATVANSPAIDSEPNGQHDDILSRQIDE